MQGFFYLAMLIGVIWLCLWAVFPQLVSRFPSPFDMRDDNEPVATEPASWGGKRQSRQPAAAAADLQHPLPEPGAAKSWRVRREQAQAPSRQRRG
jgi:hypothetical protein